jgi:hypothetical protein
MLAEFAVAMGTQMLLSTGPAPILKLIQEPTYYSGSGIWEQVARALYALVSLL